MYSNELSPHFTQTMDTSSSNISGATETLLVHNGDLDEQPLPSFNEIRPAKSFGLTSFDGANVGGLNSATEPNFGYNPTQNIITQEPNIFLSNNVSPQVTTEIIYNQNQNFQLFVVNGETMTNGSGDSSTRLDDAKIGWIPEQNSIVSSSMSDAKHVCLKCKKHFTQSSYLIQHNNWFHKGAKPFRCEKCGKRYPCEETLKAHLTKHNLEKPYKCQGCPKRFNYMSDLRRHMCVHSGHKDFTCDTCGKGFTRKDQMMKHKGTHAKKTSNLLSYPTFERPLPTGGLLQQPPNQQPTPNTDELTIDHTNLNRPPTPALQNHTNLRSYFQMFLKDTIDEAQSYNTFDLDTHKGQMDNTSQCQMYPNELAPQAVETLDSSSANISAGTENNEQKEDLDEIFDDLLSIMDANMGDLSSVTDSNSRENPTPKINILEQYIIPSDSDYQTDVMDSPDRSSEEADQDSDNVPQVTAEFKTNQNQNFQPFVVNGFTITVLAGDSSEEVNIEEKPEENRIVPPSMSGAKHVCFDCKKSFSKPCFLTLHNNAYHSGAKPFKCGKCGKKYSCESSLRDHQIKHNREKPYKCQQCPKQFNYKHDLKRHMCVHTGHKPFLCVTCGKGFTRNDQLMKHKKTHTKKTLKTL